MNTEEQEAWQRGHDLADLRWHWGMAYVITWESGQFCASAAIRALQAGRARPPSYTPKSGGLQRHAKWPRQPETNSPGGTP